MIFAAVPPYRSKIGNQRITSVHKVSDGEKGGKGFPMERQILGLINQYPKIGRSRLFVLMSENGMEITEEGMLLP